MTNNLPQEGRLEVMMEPILFEAIDAGYTGAFKQIFALWDKSPGYIFQVPKCYATLAMELLKVYGNRIEGNIGGNSYKYPDITLKFI